MHRSGLCPLCGRPLEVCTSEEGQGPDFGAEVIACRATMAILSKRYALEGDDKKPNPYASALLWAATTRR